MESAIPGSAARMDYRRPPVATVKSPPISVKQLDHRPIAGRQPLLRGKQGIIHITDDQIITER